MDLVAKDGPDEGGEPAPAPEPASFRAPMQIPWRMLGIGVLCGIFVVLLVSAIRGPRRIVALVPSVDGQSAVALLTEGGGDRAVRVDLADGKRWAADLPPYRPLSVHGGVSGGGGALTVRGLEQYRSWKTFGYDWETGEQRWSAADSGLQPKLAIPPWVTTLADAQSAYEIHMTVPNHTIFAIDRISGEERWKAVLPETWSDSDEIVRGWVRGSRLVLDQPDTLGVFDTANGLVMPIRTRSSPCVTADAIYYEPEDASELRKYSLTGDLMAPPADWGPLDGSIAGLCGNRDGATFLVVEQDVRGRVERRDATGALVGTIDLQGFTAMNAPGRHGRNTDPDATPFSGALARFVPLQVVNWGLKPDGTIDESAPRQLGLLMLDLDTGSVAWQAAGDVLGEAQLVRDGDRSFLLVGNEVVAFDPATGAVSRAVRVIDGEPIQAWQVRNGVIWVFRWDAVGALDEATLDAQSAWAWVPVNVEDTTATWKAALGQ